MVKQRIPGFLKTSRLYHVDIGRNIKVGWTALFEEWVREINAEFKAKERKVKTIDNCPAHHEIENLSHVKLIFLPPNTTLVTQPMDQGVIRSLKTHYRKRLVRVIFSHLDQYKGVPKISLLKAMQLLVSAWNNVSKERATHYFRKANISDKDQMNAVNDFNDPFKDPFLVPENMTAHVVIQ